MHIYKWTHKDSGKCYIGQSIQHPNRRRYEHINDSKHSTKTYYFHNALRKYGIGAFTWEVIDTASSIEELNLLEEKYVLQYDSINNGYNIRQPGNNKKHSPDSIERMKEAQRLAHAKRKSEGRDGGWKRKDGGPMKGKICSEEHKQKNREAHLKAQHYTGKTWKVINGKRVWLDKEAVV
jgi:group I intron endonuclease